MSDGDDTGRVSLAKRSIASEVAIIVHVLSAEVENQHEFFRGNPPAIGLAEVEEGGEVSAVRFAAAVDLGQKLLSDSAVEGFVFSADAVLRLKERRCGRCKVEHGAHRAGRNGSAVGREQAAGAVQLFGHGGRCSARSQNRAQPPPVDDRQVRRPVHWLFGRSKRFEIRHRERDDARAVNEPRRKALGREIAVDRCKKAKRVRHRTAFSVPERNEGRPAAPVARHS